MNRTHKAAFTATLAAAVVAAMGMWTPSLAGGGHHEKVTICHLPPGNPGNPQTIEVSESAVPAHLAHGDSLGFCPTVPTEEPTEEPTEQPTEEPTPTEEPEPTPEPTLPPVPTEPPVTETPEPTPEEPSSPPDQGIGTALTPPTSTEPVCVGGSLQWTETDAEGNSTHHSDASASECERQAGEAPQIEEGY